MTTESHPLALFPQNSTQQENPTPAEYHIMCYKPKYLPDPDTSRVQWFGKLTNACGDLIEIAVVAFIVTTAIARGGSWCTRNERSVLTTFATGHDGCCINSWAAELAKVGWMIHDDIFGKNWSDLVLRNNGLELLIAHGGYLVKCFDFLFR
ncbi:hypothetical protein BTUL_0222g00080 [Botrytis tulipae]|uniref:Uncharacterized protein n=1 Tax=Botrytis tulipae TaxID=87230 RepID=A0A4Z1EFM9_9HELO|nr:hypothetical protein BTUL_0222g00080 [Botrytis tulipae]